MDQNDEGCLFSAVALESAQRDFLNYLDTMVPFLDEKVWHYSKWKTGKQL